MRRGWAIEDELVRGAVPALSDLPDLGALFADPRVGATLGGIRFREEARATLTRWRQLWTKRGLGPWIFRQPDGALAGYAGLAPADAVEPGAWELLYALRPELWGRGLATRLGRLALDQGSSHSDLDEIIGFTMTTNRSSQRVMEKLGFVRERAFGYAGLPHFLYRLPRADSPADSSRAG